MRKISLTLKLAIPIAVVLVLAIGIIVFSHYQNNRQIIINQAQISGENLLEILEETLLVAPELFRSQRLNDIVLRFSKSTLGVDRISIVDRSLTIIADSDRARIGGLTDHVLAEDVLLNERDFRRQHEHGNQISFHISHPISGIYDPVARSNIIGVATIEMSIAPLQRELNFSFVMTAMVVALVGLFVGLGVYYLARRVLISPIRTLNAAAQEYGRGNLSHRITFERRDELGELASALNDMSRDLESSIEERERIEGELLRKERLAAVGQLTATVSHELRNPLGAIRTAVDVLEKLAGKDQPQLSRAIALIARSQDRCNIIIQDLLNFTRVKELDRRDTAVDPWLDGLLDEYQVPPSITAVRDLRSGVEVALDRERLHRAVLNLLDNARQAMNNDTQDPGAPEDHRLTVASGVAGGRVEITISDTGPGISPEVAEKIFEPLFTTKSFGVGLGLSVVQQTLVQHGGGIEIKSAPAGGTRAVIWLPLNEVAQVSPPGDR